MGSFRGEGLSQQGPHFPWSSGLSGSCLHPTSCCAEQYKEGPASPGGALVCSSHSQPLWGCAQQAPHSASPCPLLSGRRLQGVVAGPPSPWGSQPAPCRPFARALPACGQTQHELGLDSPYTFLELRFLPPRAYRGAQCRGPDARPGSHQPCQVGARVSCGALQRALRVLGLLLPEQVTIY